MVNYKKGIMKKIYMFYNYSSIDNTCKLLPLLYLNHYKILKGIVQGITCIDMNYNPHWEHKIRKGQNIMMCIYFRTKIIIHNIKDSILSLNRYDIMNYSDILLLILLKMPQVLFQSQNFYSLEYLNFII